MTATKKPTKSAAPPPAPAPDPTENAVPDDEVRRPPFYVREGKAITTLVGILADGAEIKPEHLAGGKDRIAELIKSGHVAKGDS